MSSATVPRRRSLHWRMAADTVRVGLLASAARLAGAAKVVVIARYFGTADALDAFFIAFLLPAFVADVVAGCVTPTLVPVLLRVRAKGGDAAMSRAAAGAATACCGLMALGAVVLALTGPFLIPLLGSSFGPEKARTAISLFMVLLLWLPPAALIATWRALLNSSGVFGVPALAPVVTPLLLMGAMWAFAGRAGVFILCAGTVAGAIVEACILAAAVRRSGFSIGLVWDGVTPELREVWRQYLPMCAGVTISSVCIVVDQAVAGMLEAGSVSALAYGTKLVTVGLGLVSTATGTVALPVFSRLAAAGEWRRLRRTALAYIGGAAAASVPAVLLLIYNSRWIVRTFYERGAFQPGATELVAVIQQYALLQVPFALALALAVRLCASAGASSVLARVAVIALVANVIGDIVFARWMGIAGIALATSVVQAVSLFALVILLLRREPRLLD